MKKILIAVCIALFGVSALVTLIGILLFLNQLFITYTNAFLIGAVIVFFLLLVAFTYTQLD